MIDAELDQRPSAMRKAEAAFARRRVASIVASAVALLTSAALPDRSEADVVVRRGEPRPLVCRIEQQGTDRLIVRVTDPDGSSRRVEIPTDEILLVVPAFDPAALERLEPGRWEGYREGAEEAASRRVDPEATALAIRLQLIVAYHGDATARAGAFAALFDLARSADEERRFRALAFRILPDADPALLVAPRPTAPAPLTDADRDLLMITVRLLRDDRGDEALTLIRRDDFPEIYSRVASILPLQQLERYASEVRPSRGRRDDLLRLELGLLGTYALSGSPSAAGGAPPARRRSEAVWSRPLAEPSPPWVDVDWTDVTEFDPRDCLFRDGAWRRP
ncbi:MAG TPA: hypothetical protein DCQ98_12980 [Planctomycetaceae bacterium]|nr:hypothetical protein [Planctomycetaceae bacterium]HRF01338.1 hypothetical protein [Pirellulaceae bacterium]